MPAEASIQALRNPFSGPHCDHEHLGRDQPVEVRDQLPGLSENAGTGHTAQGTARVKSGQVESESETSCVSAHLTFLSPAISLIPPLSLGDFLARHGWAQ